MLKNLFYDKRRLGLFLTFFLFLFVITLATALPPTTITNQAPHTQFTGNYIVESQTSIEQIYDSITFEHLNNSNDIKIKVCSTKESKFFSQVEVSKSWYEYVFGLLLLDSKTTKVIYNYTYEVPTTLESSISKSIDKVLEKTDEKSKTPTTFETGDKYCFTQIANPYKTPSIKLGENSIHIIAEEDLYTSSYLENIRAEENFSHIEMYDNNLYNELRGFNLTRRIGNEPYFEDDDNSYASFDGAGDYVGLGNHSTMEDLDAFTMSAWFKADELGAYRIYDKGTNEITLATFSDGDFQMLINNGTALNGVTTRKNVYTANEWTHSVVTYNGSSAWLYINGVAELSNIKTISGKVGIVNGNWFIGSYKVINQYFNGSIDNVQLFNSSFSQENVTRIYGLGRKQNTYADNSEVSSWKFDNSSKPIAVDSKGINNGTLVGDVEYGYDILGLQAYYPFDMDNNVTAYDFSSNDNDGVYNGTLTESSIYGLGASFDGVNDYISVADDPSLNPDYVSVSTWIKYTSIGKNKGIVSKWTTSKEQYVLVTSWATEGKLTFAIQNTLDVQSTAETTNTWNDGYWHFVVGIYNGTNAEIYVDGALEGTGTLSTGTLDVTDQSLKIGNYATGTLYFNGTIDEVMIFSNVLNSSQITNIYNNQSNKFKQPAKQSSPSFKVNSDSNKINISTGIQRFLGTNITTLIGKWKLSYGYNNTDIDTSKNGLISYWHLDTDANDSLGLNNGIVDGATLNLTGGKWGGAYEFGAGKEIYVPDSNSLDLNADNFALSLWFKSNEVPSSTKRIISKYLHSSPYNGYTLGVGGGSVYTSFNNKTDTLSISAVGDFHNGEWHHALCSGDNNLTSIYVDGVFYESDNSLSGSMGSPEELSIGYIKDYSPTYNYNGSIDEVMIFNRSLSANEVSKLYVEGRNNWNYSETKEYQDNVTFSLELGITDIFSTWNLVSDLYNFYSPVLFGDQIYEDYDDIKPICNLISITPTDIEENSTGIFEVIINCTDTSKINLSRMVFMKTISTDLTPPNYGSLRYPSNNKGSTNGYYTGEYVFLADGRGDNKWFDSYMINSSTYLFDDNYTWSAFGEDSSKVTITNGSEWALYNYTDYLEPAVLRTSIPLSRGYLARAEKYNYSIYKDNPILIEIWDLETERGIENYTRTIMRNFGYTGNPNKLLNSYYCNSSYNKTGGSSPSSDTINCVFVNSLDETEVDNIYFTDRNSSYSKGVGSVTNGKIGGITTTPKAYVYYESLTSQPAGSWKVRYTNGSSGTNVSFKDSKTAWTSTDGGITWTQAEFTADYYVAGSGNGDIVQFGFFGEDTYGNFFYNTTFVLDEIGDANLPINNPSIFSYMQGLVSFDNHSADEGNQNLNGTYYDNMTIHVNTAIDPDSVGNVTHNLTLRNTDGTFNYTINGSFKSSDDSDVHIYFDTNNVPDGLYKMNVTATSGDNANDVQSYLSENNFTIDNNPPDIIFDTGSTSTGIYNQDYIIANITATEYGVVTISNITTNIYNSTHDLFESNFTSGSDNQYSYFDGTLTDGTYYINSTACSSTNRCNDTATRTIILNTLSPSYSNVTEPTDPKVYLQLFNYIFGINWADNSETILFNWDGTNETIGNGDGHYSKTFTTLEVGVYDYYWLANNSANTWEVTPTYTYTVTQNDSDAQLWLNGVQNNLSLEEWEVLNLTGYFNGEINGVLYENGTLINNGSSPLTNTSYLPGIGYFNYTLIYQGTTNYSSSYMTWFLNVTNPNPTITITNPIEDDYETIQPITLTISGSEPLDTCWWSIDTGGTNNTFTPNSTTISGLTLGTIYSVTTWCNDTTGLIGSDTNSFNFGIETTDSRYYLYIFTFLIACLLLCIGYYMGDSIITLFGGIIFIVLGIIFWTIGYPDLTNEMLKQALSFVLWGIGAYIMTRSSMEIGGFN